MYIDNCLYTKQKAEFLGFLQWGRKRNQSMACWKALLERIMGLGGIQSQGATYD
jgi:hypothetical protein